MTATASATTTPHVRRAEAHNAHPIAWNCCPAPYRAVSSWPSPCLDRAGAFRAVHRLCPKLDPDDSFPDSSCASSAARSPRWRLVRLPRRLCEFATIASAVYRAIARRSGMCGLVFASLTRPATLTSMSSSAFTSSNTASSRFSSIAPGEPLEDSAILVLPVCAALIVGTADEWLQWFIPNRVGEIADVLLNGVAIGCGLLFSLGADPPARFRTDCILARARASAVSAAADDPGDRRVLPDRSSWATTCATSEAGRSSRATHRAAPRHLSVAEAGGVACPSVSARLAAGVARGSIHDRRRHPRAETKRAAGRRRSRERLDGES